MLFSHEKRDEETYSGSKECLHPACRLREQGDENLHIRSALQFVQLLSPFSTTAKRERHFLAQIRPRSNDVYLQDKHSRPGSSLHYFLQISATPTLKSLAPECLQRAQSRHIKSRFDRHCYRSLQPVQPQTVSQAKSNSAPITCNI